MENKRGEAWTHEETVLLIELWGDQRVQEQLENTPKRNLEILKRICQDIKDRNRNACNFTAKNAQLQFHFIKIGRDRS
jgi:GTP cyclohydrolase I